jgi:hypothetical protein
VTGPAAGMTDGQVHECWRRPSRVNTTTTAVGRVDQMIFLSRGYVYLRDGIVTAVQTSR